MSLNAVKELLLAYAWQACERTTILFVYIVSNRSRNIYIGVTRNLRKRVAGHREGKHDSYTKRYRIHRLVYFERFRYVNNAMRREKELKAWLRARKDMLIDEMNPTWEDLYPTLFLPIGQQLPRLEIPAQ